MLLSTLTKSILTHVVGLKTSREVWLTLERMFAAQSQARVIQSRYQLATLKKGASSMSEYFQKAQTIAHTLAAVATPLQDSEFVSYELARLGSDYDPLITSITTCIDPVSLEDLYGHLTNPWTEHANSAGGCLTGAPSTLAVLHASSLLLLILAMDVGEGVVFVALSISIPPTCPLVRSV